jgi:hypothetical protein
VTAEVEENARSSAVCADVGAMPIKTLAVQIWGVLRAHNPVDKGIAGRILGFAEHGQVIGAGMTCRIEEVGSVCVVGFPYVTS